jgi:hypothetical protein
MLREDQAQEIVLASINKTVGERTVSPSARLRDAGISDDKLRNLITTLATDHRVGVPRFQHALNPYIIFDLKASTSIAELANMVLELSAGKFCSNPDTPHPQSCCPYPKKCKQCGCDVL